MTCWRTRRQVGAELHEHLGGDALALADEAEEDVLGADVVVAELQRLAQRELEDLLRRGRERDVTRRRRAALADDLLDLAAHGLERDAERLERLGGDALALVDQPEQDVLGADVVVVEQARFLLRQDDHPAGPVGEAFEQGSPPPAGVECAWSVPMPTPSVSHGRGSTADRPAPRSGFRSYRTSLVACRRWRSTSAARAAGVRGATLGRGSRRRCSRRSSTDDAVPHRGRQPPDRRRRQAAAPALRGRRPAADVARRGRGDRRRRSWAACRVELVHLGSLYHDDVMDEAVTRRTVESVNARWGNLRRSSPATSCWPRRRRSPLARHRGGRPARRHHRPAVRGRGRASCAAPSTSSRTEARLPRVDRAARRRRCSPPRAASARIVAGLAARRTIDALTDVRPRASAWRSRSSTTSSTSSPPTSSWASRPGTTCRRRLHPAGAPGAGGARSPTSCATLLGSPLDDAELASPRSTSSGPTARSPRCRRHRARLRRPRRDRLRRAARRGRGRTAGWRGSPPTRCSTRRQLRSCASTTARATRRA